MKEIIHFLKSSAFHPNPGTRLAITLVYTTFGLIGNFYFLQVFCMPILWAAIWSIIVFLFIACFPFIKTPMLRKTGYFILGLGVPVYTYMIIFLADPWNGFSGYLFYTFSILLLGIGLVAFIPFYFLYHTYKYARQSSQLEKRIFMSGIVIPLVALSIFAFQFNKRYDLIYKSFAASNRFDINVAKNAKKDYFTERILGIGFLYHTKLEFWYDGARPPLHDPFINTCLWFNKKNKENPNLSFYGLPIDLSLKEKYYHYIFPLNPMRASCPCSFNDDGMSYFN